MARTRTTTLLVACAIAVLALPACRSSRTRRVVCRPTPACMPTPQAREPVGTQAGEEIQEEMVLRVHDVRDILDLMPVIERTGPNGSLREPPENSLVVGLMQDLTPEERAVVQLRATNSGAVIVRAPPHLQTRIENRLQHYRVQLVRARTGVDVPPR